MTAQELRQKYLKFFESKGHTIIPSASLVPENDPSVLFTTAGMHPLVPYLMGEKHPGGSRLVNVQKCIRTGDIDEVGDMTHHTFFEMLGNWSLGDYFKKESIEMSWEFLTSPSWLGLDKNRIAVSVFEGDADSPFDQEAYDIWKDLGMPEKRIAKLPKKNNWWGMEKGPCGPDTEIFFWAGSPEEVPESFNDDNAAWVEIWNNVFMQYDKKSNGTLEILKQNFGDKVKINYAVGVRLDGESIPVPSKYLSTENGEEGLRGEYFDNMELKGRPVYTRMDKELYFDWGGDSPFKNENWKTDIFSVRWTGKVKAPVSGHFIFDLISDDGVRFWLDDKLVIDHWTDHAPESREYEIQLVAGKEYKIKIEYYENGGGAVCKLGWTLPGEDPMIAAIKAAKQSEVVLLFAGTSAAYESEGFDRQDLVLPKNQDELIEKIASVNKNVIVVINAGSPVLMDKWLGKVKGVVFAWFGGQEMSYALSDVLSGKFNPSGKLPVTFPKRWEDCSAFSTYKKESGITEYSDGIFIGYRHFEHNNIEPLFPFGFGLSYTKFAYANLKLSAKEMSQNEKLTVTFDVKNTGKVDGGEIPQLYIRDVKASVERPVKELKGFSKVMLKPGETKAVTLTVDKAAFSFFDENSKSFITEPGEFEILIGSSSQKIELKDKIVLK